MSMDDELKGYTIKDIAVKLKNENSSKFYELLPQLLFGIFSESVYGEEISNKVKEVIIENINKPTNPDSLLFGTLLYKLGNKIYNTKKEDGNTDK